MLVNRKQLLGPKSMGKGARSGSGSGLVVIAGCNIENFKLS